MPSLSNGHSPARLPVVILYAETRGFTRMSGALPPATVLERISEFFNLAQTAVAGYRGVVRDVLNDTVVASFEGNDCAQDAVDAATDIQRGFDALEDAWQEQFGIRAAVAIGMHAGDAVIGTIDAPQPAQPVIISDSLSVAERLLHRARAGECVLSQAVMDGLPAAGLILDPEELPALALPRRDPIRIYGITRDTRLDFT